MPFVQPPKRSDDDTGLPFAHYKGDHEPALLAETIGSHFAGIVLRYPDRLAVKTVDQRLTYRQLDQQSDVVALALQSQGIRPGDRVATSLGINVAHILVIYACFKLGAILAPLNPSYSHSQVISALRHIGARCYIVSSHLSLPYKEPKSTKDLLDTILHARNDQLSSSLELNSILVVDNDQSKSDVRTSMKAPLHDFDEVTKPYEGQVFTNSERLDPHDAINLQFTSGTTSSPKAVSLSHWNLLNNAYLSAHIWGTTQEDMYVCTMPLYHCGGIGAVILAAMSHGAAVSLPGESFNALQTLRTIRDDKCTVLHGVPTMFHAWIDLLALPEFANHDFSHIRSGLLGAAPILPSLRKTLNQQLHLEDVGNTYGMTELCPALTMARPSDPLEKKYGTVGRPIPHQEVRIAARDDPHRTLRVGEKGEILGAGIVMKEYYRDRERTAGAIVLETQEDGTVMRWMRTGDEGMMDSDGFIKVTGRIKDIIIRGGENIYPPEIEDVMLQHPGVKCVSVVGLPDKRYGEVVAAFVVVDETKARVDYGVQNDSRDVDLRAQRTGGGPAADAGDGTALTMLDASQLRAWIRAKLSGHLVPKHIIWTEELPLTATGKVEKHKLQERGIAALVDVAAKKPVEDHRTADETSQSALQRSDGSLKRGSDAVSKLVQEPVKRPKVGKAMVAPVV